MPTTRNRREIESQIRAGMADALEPYYTRSGVLAGRLARKYVALNRVPLAELYAAAGKHRGPHAPHDFGHVLGTLSLDPRLARRLPFKIRVPAVE